MAKINISFKDTEREKGIYEFLKAKINVSAYLKELVEKEMCNKGIVYVDYLEGWQQVELEEKEGRATVTTSNGTTINRRVKTGEPLTDGCIYVGGEK